MINEQKEFRPLKVGSIQNKYFRRFCLVSWYFPLIFICVVMFTIACFIEYVRVIFQKVHYINKDFIKCWKEPK